MYKGYPISYKNNLERIAYENLDSENYELAINNFSKLINTTKKVDRAIYFYRRGLAKSSLKKWEEAIEDLNEAIKLSKKSDFFYYRGCFFSYLKNYDYAIRDIEKAITIYKFGDYYEELGLIYFRLKSYKKAIKSFNKAQDEGRYGNGGGLSNNGTYYRGLCYFHLENYYPASNDFISAKKKVPQYFYLKGIENYKKGKHDKALKDFNKVHKYLEEEPEKFSKHEDYFRDYFFFSGKNNFMLGKYQSALENFIKAEKYYLNDKEYYFCRGKAYLECGKYVDAIKSYEEAIKIDSTLGVFFLQRGIAKNLHNENCKKSNSFGIRSLLKDFNEAIRLDSLHNKYIVDNEEAYLKCIDNLDNDLADSYDEDLNELINILDTNFLNSRDVFFANRGLTYLHFKKYQKSLKDFDQAIELDSEYAYWFYYRAEAKLGLKKNNEAKLDCKKAISLGLDKAWKLYDTIN